MTGYLLSQNEPNPFTGTTEITYRVPATQLVRLSVHTPVGREVAVLVNRKVERGDHCVSFDGKLLGGGIYLCRLSAGGRVLTRIMIRLRQGNDPTGSFMPPPDAPATPADG